MATSPGQAASIRCRAAQVLIGMFLCLTGASAWAQDAPTEPLEAPLEAPLEVPVESAPPTEAVDPGPPMEEVPQSAPTEQTAVEAPCSELKVVRELGGEVAPADLERCGLSDGPETSEAAPPTEPAAATTARKVVVFLSGGQELRGTLLAQTETELMLLLPGGETFTLPLGAVRDIRDLKEQDLPNARGWPKDRNRSRYLYAPSAMTLPKGSGHFSQRELVFSSLSYGVHDHVGVQFGAMVPAWFGDPPETLHAILGLKTGWELMPGVHAGGGFQFLTLPFTPSSFTVGLVFGVATLGNEDRHISLAAGVPWLAESGGEFHMGETGLFVLSGAMRLTRALALVTENWWISIPDASEAILLDALAIRFVGSTFSADVGFIVASLFDNGFTQLAPIPIPWLDFSYHFGH